MNVIIHPTKLEGTLEAQPSKSITHRAIISASLSDGATSKITNVVYSEDVKATIEAMRTLGATITEYPNSVVVLGSKVKQNGHIIDCKDSGSTLRFVLPIALVDGYPRTFTGSEALSNRPLYPLTDSLEERRMMVAASEGGKLPLLVQGKLTAGFYSIDGNISSQFVSGLLFALPLADGVSVLTMSEPLQSRGYVDLTIDILAKYGIKIENQNYERFVMDGNQKYHACDITVEGDYSLASYFIVANALGSSVNILNLNPNSAQGDKDIYDIMFSFNDDETYISLKDYPDLGTALAVYAALHKGKTYFTDALRLKLKESDRLYSIMMELNKLGANIYETDDGLEFEGVEELNGGVVDSHNDHRIAMMLAIAALNANSNVKILNADCVKKSYPAFWKDFEKLGGKITYE